MRHRHGLRKLNRTSSHRLAMLRNMTNSLFTHEVIKTTLPKAKELRRVAEPLITLGKKPTLANRRLAFDRLRDRDIVTKLFNELGPRYKARPGGYLRILKFGFRQGDNAPMALVELVDRPKRGAGRRGEGRLTRSGAVVIHKAGPSARPFRFRPPRRPRLFGRAGRAVSRSPAPDAGYPAARRCGSIARWRIPSSSPAAPATSARTSSSSSRRRATRRSSSTASSPARRRSLPRLEALAGVPVPCVEADVRDVDGAAPRLPRPPDRRRRPLRRAEGGRRVRGAAARVLRRQRRRHAGARRGDGRGGRRDAACSARRRRSTGSPTRCRSTEDAPLQPQSVYGRTKRIVEDFLRDLAHANPNWRIAILRYFNPAGAHPSGTDRRGAAPTARTTWCRCCAAIAAGEFAEPRDLRHRLADARRHRRPRLPARPGSRRGARRGAAAPRRRIRARRR